MALMPVLLSVVMPWLAQGPANPAQVLSVLTYDAAGDSALRLKMVLLNAGRKFDADDAVRVEFALPGAPAKAFESAAPGPRTVSVPVACAKWAGDQVEIVDLGSFVWGEQTPKELVVRGGLASEPLVPLGRLTREAGGIPFVREYPGPEGKRKVIVAAACESLGDSRVLVKVAYFNCGERLDRNYDAFLHFEIVPTGEALAKASALGLYPSGSPTDSASWSEGDMTVVQFGPYTLPAGVPERLYLRAGLYDRAGDGKRLPFAGPDDTDRALLGALVTQGGKTWFERAAVGPAR
jgi:hypothetical protein